MIERLLEQARADAMRDIVPPGAGRARRTVHRRRAIGAGVAVASVATGAVLVGHAVSPVATTGRPADRPSAGPSGVDVMPPPDPNQDARMTRAGQALGDPNKAPWVMATAGIVSPGYEDDVNDIPGGKYRLYVYCVGAGKVGIVVKEGQYGDQRLAAGEATCDEQGRTPAILRIDHPYDGYVRVFLNGDASATDRAAFSFKFVRAS